MPFCPSCGNSVDGRFCQKCGASVGVAAAAAAGAPFSGSAAPPPPAGQAPVAAAGLSENGASALCYLVGLITGIVFLVMAPYNQNPKIRFHAFQSIFFHIAWVAAWIVEAVVMTVITTIVGYTLGAMIGLISMLFGLLVGFGGMLVWLFLMWKASQGQRIVLPIIGPIAERQAGS